MVLASLAWLTDENWRNGCTHLLKNPKVYPSIYTKHSSKYQQSIVVAICCFVFGNQVLQKCLYLARLTIRNTLIQR